MPETPTTLRSLAAALARPRMPRRRVLVLALALEVVAAGALHAAFAPSPGISVDQTLVKGHVIT